MKIGKTKKVLIIEKFNRKYYLYPLKTLITYEGLRGDEVKECVILTRGKQKVNDNLDIYIANNQSVGLSDLSTRFLYFSGKGELKRYQLKAHPRLKNFFVVEDMDKEDLEAIISISHNVAITGKNYEKTREWTNWKEKYA